MGGGPEVQLILMVGFIGALVIAGVSDAVRYIIPNSAVLTLVGLFLVAAPFAPTKILWVSHLAAGALVLAVGCLLFRYGLMGGGDVKLWAACALWTGLDLLPMQFAYVTLFGAVMATGLALLRLALEPVCAHFERGAQNLLPRLLRKGEAIPYGVAIAAGSILVVGSISSKFS